MTERQDYSHVVKQIEAIIKKVLPKFHYEVTQYRIMGTDSIAIKIAASNHEINRVKGQWVQDVSLRLDLPEWELQPQIYGGNGGQCIYRKPDMNDPKEKYLAMKSVKVPFRMPQKNEKAVMKAIERFCENYVLTLQANLENLMYRELVNFDELIY